MDENFYFSESIAHIYIFILFLQLSITELNTSTFDELSSLEKTFTQLPNLTPADCICLGWKDLMDKSCPRDYSVYNRKHMVYLLENNVGKLKLKNALNLTNMYAQLVSTKSKDNTYTLNIESDMRCYEFSSPDYNLLEEFFQNIKKFIIQTNFNTSALSLVPLVPELRFTLKGEDEQIKYQFLWVTMKENADRKYLCKRIFCKKGNKNFLSREENIIEEIALARSEIHSLILQLHSVYEVTDSILIVYNEIYKNLNLIQLPTYLQAYSNEFGLYKITIDIITFFNSLFNNKIALKKFTWLDIVIYDDMTKIKNPRVIFLNLSKIICLTQESKLNNINIAKKILFQLLFQREYQKEEITLEFMSTSKFIRSNILLAKFYEIFKLLFTSFEENNWKKCAEEFSVTSELADINYGLLAVEENAPFFYKQSIGSKASWMESVMASCEHSFTSFNDLNWNFEYLPEEDDLSSKMEVLNGIEKQKKFLPK